MYTQQTHIYLPDEFSKKKKTKLSPKYNSNNKILKRILQRNSIVISIEYRPTKTNKRKNK